MVASVCVSRSIRTPSFASTAWCSPSLHRRPGIRRPVYSSTMITWLSCTTYCTSRSYTLYARISWSTAWMRSLLSANWFCSSWRFWNFSWSVSVVSPSSSASALTRSGTT